MNLKLRTGKEHRVMEGSVTLKRVVCEALLEEINEIYFYSTNISVGHYIS